MDSIQDFEDLLELLNRHSARYLIVGGLAFIYHAKPRYTKDMDLWVDPSPSNVDRVNGALAEFGSPAILSTGETEEIVQLGVAPNRIDLLRSMDVMPFEEAWADRVLDRYGRTDTHWISLDCLLRVKEAIPTARHQEDARVLREVRRMRDRP